MAARLAIARAQRQLSDEAGVHLHIREFAVINTVGAVSLRATLNCEAFADAHRSESHFDRSSFVGLAWRPAGEACCVGALPTNSNEFWPRIPAQPQFTLAHGYVHTPLLTTVDI